MLIFGIAIQIKYNVVFEGLFFGLITLWSLRFATISRFLSYAALWVVIALTPTALAFGIYQWAGYGDAYIYSNFISIFERGSGFDQIAAIRLAKMAGLMSGLLVLAIPALFVKTNTAGKLMKAWAVTVVLSLLIFGTYYDHYALPLLPPLAIVATFSLSWLGHRWPVMRRAGLVVVALFFVGAGTYFTYDKVNRKGRDEVVDQILSHWRPGPHQGCPWFTGTTAFTLYLRSGACIPTRYPFSGHLFEGVERGATGTDQWPEIDRILTGHPPMVTIDDIPAAKDDLVIRRNLMTRIESNYVLVDRVRLSRKHKVLVYLPKPAAP